MTTIFLIAPSEGKKPGGNIQTESLRYPFIKPYSILEVASQKDLKCQGKRYEEVKELNASIDVGPFMYAYDRYNGVMYKSLDYHTMKPLSRDFFHEHFLILSGMYGLVSPTDAIGNYKIPVETKGISHYWRDTITSFLLSRNDITCIVNLLPLSYMKMIDFHALTIPIVHIHFLQKTGEKSAKITHNVKGVRGEWMRKICEKKIVDYRLFLGNHEQKGKDVHVSVTV